MESRSKFKTGRKVAHDRMSRDPI